MASLSKNPLKSGISLIVLLPFMICVGFLQLLGKIFHLNYKQISVVFNLWVQGVLLLISALIPLGASIWAACLSPSWISILCVVMIVAYASIYVVGSVCLYQHYKGPMEPAFDLCVDDLLKIADKWHVSYYTVNLIIFIFWWLALVGVNTFITIQLLS